MQCLNLLFLFFSIFVYLVYSPPICSSPRKKQEFQSHHGMRLMMINRMNLICQQMMMMKKFNMCVMRNLKKKEPFGMAKVCGVSY